MTNSVRQIRYAEVPAPVVADVHARVGQDAGDFDRHTDQTYPDYIGGPYEATLVETGFPEDSELTVLTATGEALAKVTDDLSKAVADLKATEAGENDLRLWDIAVLDSNCLSLQTILDAISSPDVRAQAANNYSFREDSGSHFNKTAQDLVGFMDNWAAQTGGYPAKTRPPYLRPAREMQRRAYPIILDLLRQYYDLHATEPEIGAPYDTCSAGEVRLAAIVPTEYGRPAGSIAAVIRPGFRYGYDNSIARPADVTVYSNSATASRASQQVS